MDQEDKNRRTVVITGCSVGAGYAAAMRMAREGWRVFAAVRNQGDADRLEKDAEGSLRAVLCDVRDRNQAFLPLLRQAKGRIINVTSGSVLFTMPMMSTYPASKLGLELLSRQLQAEVAGFGVHVCVLDPGHIKSRMTQTAGEASSAARAKLPAAANELYGDMLDRMAELSREMEGSGKEPDQVADIYFQALTESKPKAFYMVGSDAKGLRRASRWLPQWARMKIANRIMTG